MSTTGIRTFTNSNYTTTGNLNASTATINNLTITNSTNTYLTIAKRADVVHPVQVPMYRKFITGLYSSAPQMLLELTITHRERLEIF